MYRFASWRRQHAALIALVALLSLARTSFAQTPRLEVAGTVSSEAQAESTAASEPQRAAPVRPALDSLRIFELPVQDATTARAGRHFVECHISRHPLLGIRAEELACPLLFAEVQPVASSPAGESQLPAATLSDSAD